MFQEGDFVKHTGTGYIGQVTHINKPGPGKMWISWNIGFRDYWDMDDERIQNINEVYD